MWAFLIHSARSNKISPVTVAHMHGIAWYGQIWQTLTQNTLDVHVHVEEDTGKHLQSVTNFVTFCLPEEGRHPLCSGCKVGFSVSSSSPIYFKAAKRSRKTNFSFTKPMVALSLKNHQYNEIFTVQGLKDREHLTESGLRDLAGWFGCRLGRIDPYRRIWLKTSTGTEKIYLTDLRTD